MSALPTSPSVVSYGSARTPMPVFNGLPSQQVNRTRSPRRAARDRVYDDFAGIDERLKDDHFDDVNDHLIRRRRSGVAPQWPPPSPTRTVVVHDPHLEEDLRTMQERLAEEHRAREEERRRAEELLRALDRQRPDAERQRLQNEELQSKLRNEHRAAEEVRSEKEQLRQQVTELEISLTDARAASAAIL